jgi:hypothetical protein
MTTTRPGYIWSGTEWVAIGQEAAVAPVSYQATEPTSPATGDIWIDSDDEVPGITSSLNYRWRKIAAGGETSLSGNDSSGLPLAYNPGYEQVYLNGVLQYRGSDYVATTGNTITGLTALVANDTIEVLSFVTAPIGDTYTQAAADAKFVSAVNNGMFLVKPTSVTGGTLNPGGSITITPGTSSVTINNCFNATYDNYKMIIQGLYLSAADFRFLYQMTSGGSPVTTGTYNSQRFYAQGASVGGINGSSLSSGWLGYSSNTDNNALVTEIFRPFLANQTNFTSTFLYNGNYIENNNSVHTTASSYDGIKILTQSGTITGGTIRIYGYNNGA